MSNSCVGDSTTPPKNLDRTNSASAGSTSKAKKHPLAKAGDKSIKKSDLKLTKTEKISGRSPFAALLLRHPEGIAG